MISKRWMKRSACTNLIKTAPDQKFAPNPAIRVHIDNNCSASISPNPYRHIHRQRPSERPRNWRWRVCTANRKWIGVSQANVIPQEWSPQFGSPTIPTLIYAFAALVLISVPVCVSAAVRLSTSGNCNIDDGLSNASDGATSRPVVCA